MRSQPTTQEIKLRLALQTRRPQLEKQAREDLGIPAQPLCPSPDAGASDQGRRVTHKLPSASRIQGLAAAISPARGSAAARLGGLAEFLAGQKKRFGSDEPLWDKVQTRVQELENRARYLVDQAYGGRPPGKGAALYRRTHLRLVETYLYLLVRIYEAEGSSDRAEGV